MSTLSIKSLPAQYKPAYTALSKRKDAKIAQVKERYESPAGMLSTFAREGTGALVAGAVDRASVRSGMFTDGAIIKPSVIIGGIGVALTAYTGNVQFNDAFRGMAMGGLYQAGSALYDSWAVLDEDDVKPEEEAREAV